MAAEDNWQTKLPTLVERTAFIFNSEILSDVKFVVPMSTGESESKKVIPAHKFVLAISSPVFFAMFYAHAYYGFDVLFDRPVILKADKEYKIKSLIKGPTSWCGFGVQTSVECQGVQFTFSSSGDSSNGTDKNSGQFPEILFSVSK